MIGLLTSALHDAACFERDRRLALAAGAIAEGKDAETVSIDCQCWVAIAEWLETDRFAGFYGGAEPERRPGTVGPDGRVDEGPPWISWPELEEAAARALGKVKAGDDEAGQVRRMRLTCIHAKVARMRTSIDMLNNEFRQSREEIAA